MGLTISGEKAATRAGSNTLVRKDQHWTLQSQFPRTFYVIADDLAEDENSIIASIGVPPLLSLLGTTGAVCKSKKGKEIANVRHPTTGVPTVLWEVTCQFDTDIDEEEADQSPESRTPKIRWYGENEDQHLENDAVDLNKAIETVPGEPILITAPEVRPVLEIKRWEVFPFNPDVQLLFANHTNSTPFYNSPIGSALMMPIEVNEDIVDGTKFNQITYRVKFRIKFNPGTQQLITDTWKAKPLHHGFKHFRKADFDIWIASPPTDPTSVEEWLLFVLGGAPPIEPETFRDRNGNPATTNLDKFGVILPPGSSPVFLEFNRFPITDFNDLNLGPFG